MWIPQDVVDMVDDVATVRYVAVSDCVTWNKNRREGDLRLLTGWVWTARNGSLYQQGLKTKTQCYRDAYYRLVLKRTVPALSTRVSLRRVV
jgi:hypothetical protein